MEKKEAIIERIGLSLASIPLMVWATLLFILPVLAWATYDWSGWSDGSGGEVRISGNQTNGSAVLHRGESIYGPIVNKGSNTSREITLSHTDTGNSFTMYRSNYGTTAFTQDSTDVPWEYYTAADTHTFQHMQGRIVGGTKVFYDSLTRPNYNAISGNTLVTIGDYFESTHGWNSDPAGDYNGKSYIFFMTPDGYFCVVYDQTTGKYDEPVHCVGGQAGCGTNGHCYFDAAISQSTGRIFLFGGSHDDIAILAMSNPGGDISAWTTQAMNEANTELGNQAQYPCILIDSSEAENVIISSVGNEDAEDNQKYVRIWKSTVARLVADMTDTDAKITLASATGSHWSYRSKIRLDEANTSIHFTFQFRENAANETQYFIDPGYMRYNYSTGVAYYAGGTEYSLPATEGGSYDKFFDGSRILISGVDIDIDGDPWLYWIKEVGDPDTYWGELEYWVSHYNTGTDQWDHTQVGTYDDHLCHLQAKIDGENNFLAYGNRVDDVYKYSAKITSGSLGAWSESVIYNGASGTPNNMNVCVATNHTTGNRQQLIFNDQRIVYHMNINPSIQQGTDNDWVVVGNDSLLADGQSCYVGGSRVWLNGVRSDEDMHVSDNLDSGITNGTAFTATFPMLTEDSYGVGIAAFGLWSATVGTDDGVKAYYDEAGSDGLFVKASGSGGVESIKLVALDGTTPTESDSFTLTEDTRYYAEITMTAAWQAQLELFSDQARKTSVFESTSIDASGLGTLTRVMGGNYADNVQPAQYIYLTIEDEVLVVTP